MAGFEISGLGAFGAGIDKLIEAVNVASRESVSQGGHLIEAEAKQAFGPAHAKGTPKTVFDKPQSITGSLRRSVHVDEVRQIGPGIWQSKTGPSMIYGRRVELGFSGTDSLSRNYSQSAYPYMQPGLDKAKPALRSLFEGAWATALRI
jgi:hypothetical protein